MGVEWGRPPWTSVVRWTRFTSRLVDLLDTDDTYNLPEDESNDDENNIEDLLAYLDYDSDSEDD